MIDISFQGARLTINNPYIKGNIVLEFSEEGQPVDFPDLETCGYAMNMNGILTTWTRAQPVQFNLTVIPGSVSDKRLRTLLYAGQMGGREGKPINQSSVYISNAILEVPEITTDGGVVRSAGRTKFILSEGKLTRGKPVIGSNAEGKMQPQSYGFVFESVSSVN